MGHRYLGCSPPDEDGRGCWVVIRRWRKGRDPKAGSCRNGPRPHKLTCLFHAQYEDEAQRAKLRCEKAEASG